MSNYFQKSIQLAEIPFKDASVNYDISDQVEWSETCRVESLDENCFASRKSF